MLVAQITDLHLGFERDTPDEPNRQRLDRVLETLADLRPPPDLVIATGDLTEHGDAAAYAHLRDALAALPFPVIFAVGNHDDRANFLEAFPATPTQGGFVQYAVDGFALRCLVLDTLAEGRNGGAFCEVRAAWLAARLAEAPDTPTMIFLHHPPVGIGIDWMDPGENEPWIERLATTLRPFSNVVALACGHVHRPAITNWNGMTLIVAPSTAPNIALDLSRVDAEQPDGRDMIELGEPGFALHWWNGTRLVTHFAAPRGRTVARYEPAFQPLVREVFAAR